MFFQKTMEIRFDMLIFTNNNSTFAPELIFDAIILMYDDEF